jgi:hypothetical protein
MISNPESRLWNWRYCWSSRRKLRHGMQEDPSFVMENILISEEV